MKKIFLYISIIILPVALMATSVLAASDDTNTDNGSGKTAVEQLLEEVKNEKKDIVAKDMYLNIYNDVNLKPEQQTIKTISNKYGMTESQMYGLVKGGDLSVLAKKQGQLPLERIQEQYQKILIDFQEELEMEALRSELEAKVKPSEIFSDGDTSNSDFDLIYDLNIIEVILFNETSANAFGGKSEIPIPDFIDEADLEAIKDLFDKEDDEEYKKEEPQREGVDPASCIEEDSKIAEALKKFEEEEAEKALPDDEEDEDKEPLTSENFPSAQPDDWAKEYLCPEGYFYCIEFDFVTKEVKLYQNKDNCIACHVEKINKALDDIIKKPISPNKATGDLFEVPKCKSAFMNLPVNMKIITVAVPAPQPQNKDVFFQADIEKQWQKFNEIYKPFWYTKTSEAEKKDETKAEPSLEDKAARKALTTAGPDPTLEEVKNRTTEMTQSIQNQTQESIIRYQQETNTENNNQHYQLIINELSTMNTYFKAMKETFEKMKTPCNEASIKKECS